MFYSLNELRTLKVYTLDNATYKKIEDKFAELMDSKKVKDIMASAMTTPAINFYNCTGIDLTKCFNILN